MLLDYQKNYLDLSSCKSVLMELLFEKEEGILPALEQLDELLSAQGIIVQWGIGVDFAKGYLLECKGDVAFRALLICIEAWKIEAQWGLRTIRFTRFPYMDKSYKFWLFCRAEYFLAKVEELKRLWPTLHWTLQQKGYSILLKGMEEENLLRVHVFYYRKKHRPFVGSRLMFSLECTAMTSHALSQVSEAIRQAMQKRVFFGAYAFKKNKLRLKIQR